MYAGQTTFASKDEKAQEAVPFVLRHNKDVTNPYSFDYDLNVDANKQREMDYGGFKELEKKYSAEVEKMINDAEEEERRIHEERRKQQELSRSAVNRGALFTLTAYDLSEQSCGKPYGSPGYGRTATGTSLAGQTWDSARAIAVDPRVIPLGSTVYIKFVNDNYAFMDGYYTAVDTGGGIRGNHIDFFMGEGCYDDAMSFGCQDAYVLIE